MLTVEPIDDESRFLALGGAWNALLDNARIDSVFLRHEWFDAAWQWLKADHRLHLLTIFRDDDLIAVCPLVIRSTTYRRLKVRELRFLTIPDSQMCDVVCAAEDQAEVVAAVLDYLASATGDWDLCVLDKLPADSPTVACIDEGRSPLVSARMSDGDNPGIRLDGTWVDYYARRSRRLKKGNNLVANRLGKRFSEIDLQWLRAADAGDSTVDDALRAAVEVSGRSWKVETGNSLDNPGPGSFVRALTRHAVDNDWLSLWLLRLDDQPVAMEYQLAYRGQVHALRGDFDEQFSDLSPGTYMNWKLLERLFDTDLDGYHMGPGNNAYKMRWAELSEPLLSITLYSRSVRGRILAIWDRKLRPAAVALVESIRHRLKK